MLIMRTVVTAVAIAMPIQLLNDLPSTGATFAAVLSALGVIKAWERWRPVPGTNGDVVKSLQALQKTLEKVQSSLKDDHVNDAVESAKRHSELMIAINRRISA